MKAWTALSLAVARKLFCSVPVFAALVIAFAGLPRSAHAADGTWTATTSGTWGTGSNWQGGIVGTGTGFTATFAPDITSDVTVTNNQQRAVGSLVFGTVGGTGAGGWIITGTNLLVLNNNVTGPANATITVHSASATLATVIASATANNPVVVKNGTGTLILTASTTMSSKVSVTAGTLQISSNDQLGANPGTFTADQLAISNGATLRTTAAVTLGTNRGITIGSGGGTLSINGGGLTYAGRLTGSGNTATVTGSSPLTLQNSTGTPTDVNWDFASNNGIRTFFEGRNALGTGSVQVRNGVRLTSQSMTTGTISNAVTLDSGAGLTARSSGGGQTYTNVIFPSSGTVVFNKDDQTTSNLTISSGGALTGNLTVDTTQGGTNAVGSVFLNGVFSGDGGLVKSGTGVSGRVVLRGANTYTGTTRINTGTLQLGGGGTVGSLSTSSLITGSAGATLVFNRSDTITAGVDFTASAIAGGMNLAQVGSGTLVLAGTNTYTGKTSIANGTLEISAAAQLGGNPASFVEDQLTISNSGTLRTTAAVTLNNRGVVIGSGGGTLDINGAAMSYAGRFTGPGETLRVTGANALTISNTTGVASSVNWDFASNSGVRTFFRGSNALGTGTVTVRNGVSLVSEVTAPTGGQVNNAVTLDSGAGISARSSGSAVTYTNVTLPTTGTVTFNRDDQVTAALTIASGRELTGILTVDTSQQISGAAVGDVTLSGIFSGAGGLEKTGTGASGRLILAGVNTYTGPTTVSAGVLALGTNGAIASSPLVKVESGATFNVTQKVGGYVVPVGQTLAGSGTVAGDVSFGTGATLAPGASPGTLTITGNSIFAPGGNYNWQIYDAAGMAGSPAGWDLVDIGGVLDVVATTESPFAINLWSLSGVGPDVDGNALNFSATTSGTWRIATAAGGITNFDATKFTINTSAINGTAGFSNSLSSGTFSLAQAGNDLNLVFTLNAPPPTSLTWYGDGATAGGSGGWSTSGTTWFDGSAVRAWEPAAKAVFGGATSGTVTLDTGVSANDGLEFATSGYTVAGSGLTLGGTTNAISVAAAAAATISAPLAGTAGFAKTGDGTLALAGANTVSGAVAVDAGRLDLGDGGTAGSLGSASGVAVASGAVFAVNRSDNVSQGTAFPTISGAGGFAQAGPGTTTLTQANTYTGPTAVNAGTLRVNGDQTAATGAVTVASGATLAGTGTVGGATTIQSGATLSPGASPGTLSFAQGLTWAGGGNYAWQVYDAQGTAGSTTGWDLVSVGGVLDVAATSADKFNINLWSLSAVGPDTNGSAINFSATSSGTWRIATAAGGITGFDAAKFAINVSATNGTGGFANNLSNGTFSLVQSGNDVNLVFTPGLNPNPTTLTWYGDGVNPGGAGTWDTTANTWFDGTAVRPWVPGAKAIFSGSAGTVTLGSGVSANGGIQFASTGFTLSGAGLTLGGTSNAVEVATGATATVSAALSGTAGLAKTGAGTLSLAAANTYTGATLVQTGTVLVANGGATANSPVTVQAGGAVKIDPAVTMRAPSLTLSGSSARLDGTGATVLVNGTAGIGQFVIASGTVTGRPSLSVSGSGQVSLPTDLRLVMDLTALAIEQASGGKLDIGKGRINIGIGGITEADLRADIISGRTPTGTFTGTSGIMTTGGKASATSPNPVVGYRVFATGSAAVAWAAFGDTNLDGQVTPTDISLINQGGKFGQGSSTGSVWFQGDYNYSGGVTPTDISLINQANLFAKGSYLPVVNQGAAFGWDGGVGGLGGSSLSSLGGTTLVMGVPEPGTWALAVIGIGLGTAVAGRRRYRGLATGRRP